MRWARTARPGEPGGQVLLTLVDEDWRRVPGLREAVLGARRGDRRRAGATLYVSIELGGMLVVAGNEAGARRPARRGAADARRASRCGWSITARSTAR